MENLVNLCMDSYSMEQQKGRIYHLYSGEPVTFCTLPEAFKKMDDLYDDIDFPQAATRIRSFRVDERKRKTSDIGDDTLPDWTENRKRQVREAAALEKVLEHRGTGATFIIRVKYRQNSSWQGEVTWVDGKKKKYFRSALELMKLLDSALEPEKGQ